MKSLFVFRRDLRLDGNTALIQALTDSDEVIPCFRIFNPWRQQERFGQKCKYIKEWIPELRSYSPKEIHNWKGCSTYPEPIIDHKSEARRTLELFKLAS